MMIPPITSPISSGAPAAAAGVKGSPEIQRPDSAAQERLRRPAMDEYIPEEKREPSGRYWIGKDEDGRPKVYFDDPERAEGADSPESKASEALKQKPAEGKNAETCTGSTDQVDREIERLKKKKEQLEQRLNSETDEAKKEELREKLAQVENELRQKDNDAYRRQHMVVSRQS